MGIFGSNVPQALLIDPWNVSPHRKKFPHSETEALLGKNRPKLTKIRKTRNAKFTRTHLQRADFFTILSESKFHGESLTALLTVDRYEDLQASHVLLL